MDDDSVALFIQDTYDFVALFIRDTKKRRQLRGHPVGLLQGLSMGSAMPRPDDEDYESE